MRHERIEFIYYGAKISVDYEVKDNIFVIDEHCGSDFVCLDIDGKNFAMLRHNMFLVNEIIKDNSQVILNLRNPDFGIRELCKYKAGLSYQQSIVLNSRSLKVDTNV